MFQFTEELSSENDGREFEITGFIFENFEWINMFKVIHLYIFLYADGDVLLFISDKNYHINSKFCMCITIFYTKYGMADIHVNIHL